MDHATERIRQAATRHAKTAKRLWREAKTIRETQPDGPVEPAIAAQLREMNERAIDESRQAANGFDFLKRYPNNMRGLY